MTGCPGALAAWAMRAGPVGWRGRGARGSAGERAWRAAACFVGVVGALAWGALVPTGLWAGGKQVPMKHLPMFPEVSLGFAQFPSIMAPAAGVGAGAGAFGRALVRAHEDALADEPVAALAVRHAIKTELVVWRGLGDVVFPKPHGMSQMESSDHTLLQDIYIQAGAVFEYGLGESTLLAAAARVPRLAGVDADGDRMASVRQQLPLHYRLYVADVPLAPGIRAEGRGGGGGGGGSRDRDAISSGQGSRALAYQLAPLAAELTPFDVYLVNGNYRPACVAAAFLHAATYGHLDAVVVLNGFRDMHLRATVLQVARLEHTSLSENLAILRRDDAVDDDKLLAFWMAHRDRVA